MAHTAPITVNIPGIEALTSDLHRLTATIDADDNTTAGIAVRAIQLMREAGEQRDGAYRERAQLLAWLAALHPAVRTLAPDVTEPGWQILYINPTTGGQLSWYIAPRDIELFEHVEYLPANSGDERAVWDGHTTQAKYERIASLTRFLADVAEATGTPPCTCTFEAKCPNCRTEDGGAEQRVTAALDVIHEWQRNGEPNDYLTRVHRALAPPTSGTSTGPLATTEDGR